MVSHFYRFFPDTWHVCFEKPSLFSPILSLTNLPRHPGPFWYYNESWLWLRSYLPFNFSFFCFQFGALQIQIVKFILGSNVIFSINFDVFSLFNFLVWKKRSKYAEKELGHGFGLRAFYLKSTQFSKYEILSDQTASAVRWTPDGLIWTKWVGTFGLKSQTCYYGFNQLRRFTCW